MLVCNMYQEGYFYNVVQLFDIFCCCMRRSNTWWRRRRRSKWWWWWWWWWWYDIFYTLFYLYIYILYIYDYLYHELPPTDHFSHHEMHAAGVLFELGIFPISDLLGDLRLPPCRCQLPGNPSQGRGPCPRRGKQPFNWWRYWDITPVRIVEVETNWCKIFWNSCIISCPQNLMVVK